MTKIMFLSNWGESSSSLLERYSNQTPKNSGKWGKIEGTSNFEKADFFVVMDGFEQSISHRIDWSKVIYFQREPETIRPLFMNHDFPNEIFFKGTYNKFYNVPIWWVKESFDNLEKIKYPKKTKKISTITSGKYHLKSYEERLAFLNKFCKFYKNIDVYGRGVQNYVGQCWKGELNYNGNCKLLGHLKYEYSIVLENTHIPNSWTEKFADSILGWSLPIYSGDSNISKYFPEESFYKIDVNECDLREIQNFILEPPNKIQISALEQAREDLLYKWNIWPAIEQIIYE